jgi:Zn-dependent peptidase ImmA (M78 family)
VATHSVSSLLSRLSRGGFKRDFVRSAILPDWWDDSLQSDARLLPDIELRVARFLGLPLAEVRDPSRPLAVQAAHSTVLRKTQSTSVESLHPAIHTARRVAEAVLRYMGDKPPRTIPASPEDWRRELASGTKPVTLEVLLHDLWGRGIPVIPMECLPSPAFQGMACVISGRPTIVIGQKFDVPSRIAFFVAHETGHIAAGDCADGQIIVDESEAGTDSSEMEKRADRFASRVLLGDADPAKLSGADSRDLARQAYALQQQYGADAGALIFHWARRNSDNFTIATLAVKALYQDKGARKAMAKYVAKNVNTEDASETDRALLSLVSGGAAVPATVG